MKRGKVSFDGVEIQDKTRLEMRPFRSRMQVVFQEYRSSLNPRMSIGQIIEEGLVVNRLGATKAERQVRVKEALIAAGMPDKHPVALPARIFRRPAPAYRIARAIALEPHRRPPATLLPELSFLIVPRK